MSLDLKVLLSLSSKSRDLMQARHDLFDSLHPRRVDRRREARVPIPEVTDVPSRGPRGKILNLGLCGLAVQVENHCCFARGERHRLTVSQGPSSIDVEGIVRWTNSDWEDRSASRQNGYRQTAGFSIQSGATQEEAGAWQSIAGMIQAAPKYLSISRFEAVKSRDKADH